MTMKRFLYAALAIFVTACCWICLSPAQAQPAAKDSSVSTAATAQDVERYNQLVRSQEDKAKRVETLLVRQEQLMDKQEAAFTRFQKILDTWERQQKQYQQYLDTLKK